MNQLQILEELKAMRERFKHYERLNKPSPAGFAYAVAARNVSRLMSQVLAEGVEINERGYDTTAG
jgi:hypothetical protein